MRFTIVVAALAAILSPVPSTAQEWMRHEDVDRSNNASYSIAVMGPARAGMLIFNCATNDPEIIGAVSKAAWPSEALGLQGQKLTFRVDKQPPGDGVGRIGRSGTLMINDETTPRILAVLGSGKSLGIRVTFDARSVDLAYSLNGAARELAWLKAKCGDKQIKATPS